MFATRLTRLTRALASRNPERAIQRAAAAAPDWSSGTRIGDALKAFNDRHGRRGMARGAVVVILSDGWERGDPALVGREMARLARLAHRIVWVNPRVAAGAFAPRAGGMAAALPHCDALVSGHSLDALDEVAAAIAGPDGERGRAAAGRRAEDEPWASATPVPAARWRCPAATARAAADDAGWGRDDDQDVHLPGLRAPRRAAARARRPAAQLLRPRGAQRPDGAPGAERLRETNRRRRWPARHTARCSCACTRRARWSSASPPRPMATRAVRRDRRRGARRPGPRRQGRAGRQDRFGTGHGYNTSPSAGTRGDRQRDGQDPRQGAAARRRGAGAAARRLRWENGAFVRRARRSPTSRSTPTARARCRPASRAASTRRRSTETERTHVDRHPHLVGDLQRPEQRRERLDAPVALRTATLPVRRPPWRSSVEGQRRRSPEQVELALDVHRVAVARDARRAEGDRPPLSTSSSIDWRMLVLLVVAERLDAAGALDDLQRRESAVSVDRRRRRTCLPGR